MDCTPPGHVAPPAQGGASAQAYSTVLPLDSAGWHTPRKGKDSQEGTAPRLREGRYAPDPMMTGQKHREPGGSTTE